MNPEKFNAEGYFDPTTYEALNNVAREEKRAAFKPLVYICSPYSGDVETNVRKAREFSRFAVNSNCIPLAPHLLLPQYMKEPEERELALFMDIVLLGKCQEMWVLGGTITDGMERELAVAKRRKQKIRYFDDDFKEVREWEIK